MGSAVAMQNEDPEVTLPEVTAASRSPEAVEAFGFGDCRSGKSKAWRVTYPHSRHLVC